MHALEAAEKSENGSPHSGLGEGLVASFIFLFTSFFAEAFEITVEMKSFSSRIISSAASIFQRQILNGHGDCRDVRSGYGLQSAH